MYISLLLCLTQIILIGARRECHQKHIIDADTVCVCNSTYCDDFPPLQKSKQGLAYVFESNKAGDRFKQSEVKVEAVHQLSNATEHLTVTIDPTRKFQTIKGFGGAFTDTTGQMLKQVSESLAHEVINSYFSENGIEYTIGRIPIAGTDYSPRPYSYDDVDGDTNLTHFALQKEDLEWKIPYIKMAQEVSPHKIKLFGSPWSPPAWMKTNRKFNESGSLRGEVGGEYYQIWANYFVKFLSEYKSHGIELWGLTVENEPIEGQKPNYTFNNLNLNAHEERDFIKLNLGPTLAKAGYNKENLHLMIYDENTPHIKEWTDIILKDKEAAKYVSGIAIHWYSNKKMGAFPDKYLDYVHEKHPDYFMLNSEACHHAIYGKWQYAEEYGYDIIRDLNHWVTGWVEWNMALDMTGGPRWNTKQGCGGPILIDPNKGEAYKQPSFYALGHFSKFISPNSVRIGHKLDKSLDNLSVLTIKRPDNATVVVALNSGPESIELNVNDSRNYISHKLSAHSINSFIWW